MLAFEHVEGRHADLSPGSEDLAKVAKLLSSLSEIHRPGLPVLPIERRWAPFSDVSVLRRLQGDTLAHMDVTAENILIGDRVWLIDWAWPCRAASWLDTAGMVVRLIQAGHTPEEAEQWAQQIPAWAKAAPEALTAYADARAALGKTMDHGVVYEALTDWRRHLGT